MSRMFSTMQKKKTVALYGNPDTRISVLTMMDLTAMLLRMTSETWFNPGIYYAGGSQARLENLRDFLLSIRPDASIEYYGKDRVQKRRGTDDGKSARFRIPAADPSACDGLLEEIYRLPVSTDWGKEVLAQYGKLLDPDTGNETLKERLSPYAKKFGSFAGALLDLAVMFLIAEYLSRITSESVYFKIVDVRLLFVILMGMMHGLAIGSAAAFLECLVLVIHYGQIGISGLLLFYNVENWIPFVYYITAGVICGYTHQKHSQQIRSVSAENELIRNKYLFLSEAYRAGVSDKQELRAQVLSEENSYSSLYGAMQQMAQRTPEAVCVEAVRVMRRILDNETLLIYQMDASGREAQLLSCCLENAGRQVIRMSDCPEMTDVILDGGIWKNTAFLENAPMYATMVRYRRLFQRDADEREIMLIVTIEQAGSDQLGTWYMNHFSIMCGLLKDSLERASLRERILE